MVPWPPSSNRFDYDFVTVILTSATQTWVHSKGIVDTKLIRSKDRQDTTSPLTEYQQQNNSVGATPNLDCVPTTSRRLSTSHSLSTKSSAHICSLRFPHLFWMLRSTYSEYSTLRFTTYKPAVIPSSYCIYFPILGHVHYYTSQFSESCVPRDDSSSLESHVL